ncbi:hypothetical protein [Mucilaginibacter sp.]|uniref:hypothetical protein n=1 Tax=Mucilaginibacter sp. TaxID=1882438 RepID=UPI002ED0B562
MYNYGFTADSSGLQTQYIDDLGQDWGHVNVTLLTPTTGSGDSSGLQITGSGILLNGDRIMMTFNAGAGADHAVVVTGAYNDSFGGLVLEYYDPTTGQNGTRNNNDYSDLYGVGAVGSHP